MFPDLNESDARQAIESLMDEEASIAEDPTQNAMLPQAQNVRVPEDNDVPGDGEVSAAQESEIKAGEPEDIPIPEHPADEAVELDDYDPNEAVAQSESVPEPTYDAQDAPQSDPAYEDESSLIRQPEPVVGDSEVSDEEYVEQAEPFPLPAQEFNRRPVEEWHEGQLAVDQDPEPDEPDDPYGRAMADVDWKMTLQSRGGSLS